MKEQKWEAEVTHRSVTARSHYLLIPEEIEGKSCWIIRVVPTKTELTEQWPRSHTRQPLLLLPPSPEAPLEGGKIASPLLSPSNLLLMLPLVEPSRSLVVKGIWEMQFPGFLPQSQRGGSKGRVRSWRTRDYSQRPSVSKDIYCINLQ